MSRKSPVDDSVIERRLRPIYDFLDNGNNKKAIQEADKALKKQPTLFCASVLKALALLRMGRDDQCTSVMDKVTAQKISDDATLQAITMCYRELNKPNQICKIYEDAVKLEPNNEELCTHLFMSYVRIGDAKKQKAAAMQLYKLNLKTPYYFWAVMSTIMQSLESTDTKSQNIALQLAERMVTKREALYEFGSEEEVRIYLYILELQGKYEEAQLFLQGPYCKKLKKISHYVQEKKAIFLKLLGRHEEANSIYKELIVQQPDNWMCYVNYICTLINMTEIDSAQFQEGCEFLNKMKQSCEDTKFRCPLLSHLQLALSLTLNGNEDKINIYCGNPVDKLYNYISLYGEKGCCFQDIVNLIPLIEPDYVDDFLNRIENLVEFSETNMPIDIKNIYMHERYLQLHCTLKLFNGTGDEHVREGHRFAKFYSGTEHLCYEMAPTDIRANHTYLVMAMHKYFLALTKYLEENTKTNTISHLILYMCGTLRYAINLSRTDFQLKFLLIKLYIMIGASEAAGDVYETLALKHVQFDSLGYIISFHVIDNGCFVLASNILSASLKFFSANYRDISDALIMSYKYGSFTRITEFMEFRKRLNHSLHFASCTTERMMLSITMPSSPSELLDILKQINVDELCNEVKLRKLVDNRAYDVMGYWPPPNECLPGSPTIEESIEGEINMLRLRNLMLRIISTSVESSDHRQDSSCDIEESMDVNSCVPSYDKSALSELISQLDKLVKSFDIYKIPTGNKFPLPGPDIPRLYLYLKQPYIECFLKHCSILMTLQNASSSSKVCLIDLISTEEIVNRIICDHIKMVESIETAAMSVVPYVNKDILSYLTHAIQTFSLITVIMGCCCNTLQSAKSSKKNRKKKGNPNDNKNCRELSKYLIKLQEMLVKLESAIRTKLKIAEKVKEATAKIGSQEVYVEGIMYNVDRPVTVNIERSFCHSLNHLLNALSSKIKYLSGLRV